MENSVPRIISRTESRPIIQTIAGRRASLNSIMLSRSAPDAFTLAQLTPLNRRASLPDSPSCSVATQTPTDAAMHFEFPDESFEFDIDSDDMLDGISALGDGESRQQSPTAARAISNSDSDSASASGSPPELSLWDRCLRRLSSHSDIVRGVGLHRRVSFTEQPTELKVEVQDVGLQLRSIGDDFERSRFTRSRSLSFVNQKKR